MNQASDKKNQAATEPEVPAKGRKAKKAKEPKGTKEPKRAKGLKKAKAPRKKKKLGRLVVVLFIVLLLMISGASAYLLIMRGNADYTYSVIKTGKTFADVVEAELITQKKAVEDEKTAWEAKNTDLIKREEDIAKLEEKLKKQQEDLDRQANTITSTRNDRLTEEETANLIAIYEKMDPAKAADIFGKMNDLNKVGRLLVGMKQTAASKILQAMDPALAAQITKLIMANDGVSLPLTTFPPLDEPTPTATPTSTSAP